MKQTRLMLNNREFTEDEVDDIICNLGELIHSKSLTSDIHYDIYDLLCESKYFDLSELIHDLPDWELQDIAKDYINEREVAYEYLDSLPDGQLRNFFAQYNQVDSNVRIDSLDDEYRYKLCMALFNKTTSSFELEKVLGDDLVNELRYSIRL